MTAVNFLIVLVLCSVIGAFTGLMLGDAVGNLSLAIIAGFIATVVAVAARNIKIPQLVVIYSALAIERPIPLRLAIYSVITSLIGGAAAIGIASTANVTSSVTIGSMGGFFAGLLIAILLTVYEMNRYEGSAAS